MELKRCTWWIQSESLFKCSRYHHVNFQLNIWEKPPTNNDSGDFSCQKAPSRRAPAVKREVDEAEFFHVWWVWSFHLEQCKKDPWLFRIFVWGMKILPSYFWEVFHKPMKFGSLLINQPVFQWKVGLVFLIVAKLEFFTKVRRVLDDTLHKDGVWLLSFGPSVDLASCCCCCCCFFWWVDWADM